MAVFEASPYSLTQSTLIKVRVFATNAFGSGVPSSINSAGAQVRVIPHQITTVGRGSETSTNQIQVSWTAPDDGGSSITSYHLVWDEGTGTTDRDLVGLVVPYTLTSHTVSISGSVGTPYNFKVRAKNIYGWGPYSNIVSILASDVPSQMQVVTTTVDGTNVEISWQEPANNGEAISGYEIQVLQSDGTTFSQETGSCDGINNSTVISTRSC